MHISNFKIVLWVVYPLGLLISVSFFNKPAYKMRIFGHVQTPPLPPCTHLYALVLTPPPPLVAYVINGRPPTENRNTHTKSCCVSIQTVHPTHTGLCKCLVFCFSLIVCFTSYFVFSVAVLPRSPGVVYYHLLLRPETRIPGAAPVSFRMGIFCAQGTEILYTQRLWEVVDHSRSKMHETCLIIIHDPGMRPGPGSQQESLD